MQGEMPGFPFPGRPGGEHDEPLLDMIIARRALPPTRRRRCMTWRVCSPPWPGRENPGSWPGRRQCGLPSGGPPLQSASHPLPDDQYGTDDPGGLELPSRARLATALVVTAAGLGSVLAAYTDVLPSPIQQVAHVAVAAPAPHRTGSLPSTATSRVRRAACHAPADQPARAPGPSHSPGTAQRPSHWPRPKTHLSPTLWPPSDHGPTGSTCSPGLGNSPIPSPQASGRPRPVVTAGVLHGQRHVALEPAHPAPVRSLTCASPSSSGCIRAAHRPVRLGS